MRKYIVLMTESAKSDIIEKKKYIINNFHYYEYAQNYSDDIKNAIQALESFPTAYKKIGFQYRNRPIYLKPYKNHLLFFTVDKMAGVVTVLRILKDGMDWEQIINTWLKI